MRKLLCLDATRARKLFYLNVAFLVFSIVVWVAAFGFGWLESVTFVSHVSMAALVMSAVAGIAAGDAAVEAEDA
jgi:hypothetical protein